MGLVKVEALWSRKYRLYTQIQNLIQCRRASNRFRVSFCRSQLVFLVLFIYFAIYAVTTTMAEENKHLTTVLRGNGLFTRNLYKILAQEKNQNIFFSPVSIHAILSLAAQGSAGNTRKSLTDALQVPDIATLAEGYKEAMKKLNSVEDVTLLMANKVYLKEDYALQESFKNIVISHFFSEVQNINFEQNAAAAKTINTWVEDKTKNKIKDLIQADDLDADTRLVLVNAIYFKGKWAKPFDPSNTRTEKFYLNDQDTIDVKMMHIKKNFYFKNDEDLDAKLLELPYTNKDLSMIVILPNKRNGIEELEAKLANTDLTKITEGMFRPEVIVSLPKFKIETTIDLNEPLSKLGLSEMFTNSADFSGMLQQKNATKEELKVSKVIQKAFIEVNEEGAEAAAATAKKVILKKCLKRPIEPQVFEADHGFIIVLKENMEDKVEILFKGRILQPTSAS